MRARASLRVPRIGGIGRALEYWSSSPAARRAPHPGPIKRSRDWIKRVNTPLAALKLQQIRHSVVRERLSGFAGLGRKDGETAGARVDLYDREGGHAFTQKSRLSPFSSRIRTGECPARRAAQGRGDDNPIPSRRAASRLSSPQSQDLVDMMTPSYSRTADAQIVAGCIARRFIDET